MRDILYGRVVNYRYLLERVLIILIKDDLRNRLFVRMFVCKILDFLRSFKI